MPKHFTKSAVAQMFHVSTHTVSSWVEDQLIECYYLPNHNNKISRFTGKAILEFAKARKMPMPPMLNHNQKIIGEIIADYFLHKQFKDDEYIEPQSDEGQAMETLLIALGLVEIEK